MWILQLNPMTANAERVVPVAQAESREALEAFLERERVEPYSEGQWFKTFRKGGPLENYNPPDSRGEAWIGVPAIADVGAEADWMRRASEDFNRLKNSLVAA